MALHLIRSDNFSSVLSVLNDPETIYVIPTFQRPYAWSEDQVKDLLQDMEKASPDGRHYMSALHLIPIAPGGHETPMNRYVDYQSNKDLALLEIAGSKDNLRTDRDNPVKVYAVIDGQQRLTTLFFLAHIYYANRGNLELKSTLAVRLHNGMVIPRIIQNPPADHDFMMALVDDIWTRARSHTVKTASQSQERMLKNVRAMEHWADLKTTELFYLTSDRFKTGAIELDADYGLISFMTLNDRGKPLTVLERTKSLLLQYADESHRAGHKDMIPRLLTSFGDLYHLLNECQHTRIFSEKNGDGEMVKMMSCYLRLNQDRNAIYEGADAAYDDFFRFRLAQANMAEVSSLIETWCSGMEEMCSQLRQFNNYLSYQIGNEPSLHFPASQTLSDDYRVVVLSLQLQPHLFALLLKYRALFNREWHEPLPIRANPVSFQMPIQQMLAGISEKTSNMSSKALNDYIGTLSSYKATIKTEMSMLEVVERMQMIDWNQGARRLQEFVNFCVATFSLPSPGDFVNKWAAWRSPEDFLRNILDGYNETNFRYLLKEYERSLGNNLHFEKPPQITTNDLELEHVLAVNIENDAHFNNLGGFAAFGIINRDEYVDHVLYRSGNLTWLSASANESLGNTTPDLKAADYFACHGHPSGNGVNMCSTIAITRKLGQELKEYGTDYPAIHLHIEARCAELAIFAMRRFC